MILFRVLLVQFLWVIFLSFTHPLFLQSQEDDEVNIHIDFAQFKGNDDVTILEIFYSIPRKTIAHIKTENGMEGEFNFTCKVFHRDSLIDKIDWSGKDFAESEAYISINKSIND